MFKVEALDLGEAWRTPGRADPRHHRPCVAHPIAQRLLIRSACKLDAFEALNEHFRMHDFWPMTSDAHCVGGLGRWMHWIW